MSNCDFAKQLTVFLKITFSNRSFLNLKFKRTRN